MEGVLIALSLGEGSAAAIGEALATARTGAVSLAQCGARGEARRSHPDSPSQLTEPRIFGERATVSTDRQYQNSIVS